MTPGKASRYVEFSESGFVRCKYIGMYAKTFGWSIDMRLNFLDEFIDLTLAETFIINKHTIMHAEMRHNTIICTSHSTKNLIKGTLHDRSNLRQLENSGTKIT